MLARAAPRVNRPSLSQRRFASSESTRSELENDITQVLSAPESKAGKDSLKSIRKALELNPDILPDALHSALVSGPSLELQGYDVKNAAKKKPVRVAVTGAAGQIGYSLIPRIASGEMLGEDQPVVLQLLERSEAMNALEGVVMEIEDCAFPLVKGINPTDSLEKGFKDTDYILHVGAKPRGPGMERADVLKDNAKIFAETGKAMNKAAKQSTLSLVVGNPANTNALIAASNAPNIPGENFSAMTRLDHDRALAQIAIKTGADISDIEGLCIWGNHSATQYPDISNAKIKGKAASQVINDNSWFKDTFIPAVQKRGAEIIKARGLSSAASAADAAIKHMHDWALGSNGQIVSMAVPSDGSYDVQKGIYSSFPVICKGDGKYDIVKGLQLDSFSKQKIAASVKELMDEKQAVKSLLN
eukprot:gb/GECH01011930.1/.p1 GENE.gb/GECH01011930.1/~~gb/GECH01011930.1/.p1  ORF type:complete len:416 (+),score=99.44 gb/GECH01011930.1/:1-1248(+)